MTESNRINLEALVSVQRAFITSQTPQAITYTDKPGQAIPYWLFTVPWENSGSTPTREALMHVSLQVRLDELPIDFKFPDLGDPENTPTVIGPKGVILTGPLQVDASIIKAVQKHERRLYIWGWATYRDIFENTKPHITKFCREVTEVKGDPLKTKIEMFYTFCPRHNCTDEECKGQPEHQPTK